MAIHMRDIWRLAGKQLNGQGILPEATYPSRSSSSLSSQTPEPYLFPTASAVAVVPRRRPRLELLSGSRLEGVSCCVQRVVKDWREAARNPCASTTQLGGLEGLGTQGSESTV